MLATEHYMLHSSLVWELRGDIKEKEYYEKVVAPLLYQIFKFKVNPKFQRGKNGCFGIQTTNKDITSFLLKYGFKPGRKSGTVKVPDIVFESTKNSIIFSTWLF